MIGIKSEEEVISKGFYTLTEKAVTDSGASPSLTALVRVGAFPCQILFYTDSGVVSLPST